MARKTGAAMGDSQTDFENNYGIPPRDTWTGNVGRGLRSRGLDFQMRGFGKSGDTTLNMLDRLTSMFLYDLPDLGVIYGGVNDPGNGILQAATQLNIEASLMAMKHGAKGDGLDGAYVAGQANLPAGAFFGQRVVVLADTSASGGAAAWHPEQAPTIGGAVTGPNVWEFRQPLAGEAGWGRVARNTTAPTVVDRLVVVTANYLNWTTGGDDLATPYASYTGVRAAQAAAVAAQNVVVDDRPSVVLADLYTFQRSRIVAGTDPDFKAVAYDQARSWHVANSNQHHSAYGHALVAQCVQAAMPAAWLNELAA